MCFTPRYFYHGTLYGQLMFNAFPPFSTEHAPRAVAVAVSGRYSSRNANMKNARLPRQCLLSDTAFDTGLADGYVSAAVFRPFPHARRWPKTLERRYCPRKDTINTRRAIATITLCTRCKRPELAGDEDIIALSVSIPLTPFIASRSIFRREMHTHTSFTVLINSIG